MPQLRYLFVKVVNDRGRPIVKMKKVPDSVFLTWLLRSGQEFHADREELMSIKADAEYYRKNGGAGADNSDNNEVEVNKALRALDDFRPS
jgi:hypothetical protein